MLKVEMLDEDGGSTGLRSAAVCILSLTIIKQHTENSI